MKKMIMFLSVLSLFGVICSLAFNAEQNYQNTDADIRRHSVNSIIDSESSIRVVSFDLRGGKLEDGSTTIPDQVLAEGELFPIQPESPKKEVSGNYIDPNTSQYVSDSMKLELHYWATEDNAIFSFGFDFVTSDITLHAVYRWRDNYLIESQEFHLSNKYRDWSTSIRTEHLSTMDVVNARPVEIGGLENQPYTRISNFPNEELGVAKTRSGIVSTYGGCGPLALISQLDFLARYKGYSSLLPNVNNFDDRVNLATSVFNNTVTHEVGVGTKSTFTFPHDFIGGANTTLSDYGYSGIFNITEYGGTYTSLYKINKVKECIEMGMPAVIWTSSLPSEAPSRSNYSDHYFQVYGYEEWVTFDSYGNRHVDLLFVTRPNWGREQNQWIYLDTEIFTNTSIWGMFEFEEINDEKVITQDSYGYECQYFFDAKTKEHTFDKYNYFITRRLRTGYIQSYDSNNNPLSKYLVMSPKREGAGTAYLDYEFENWIYVKGIGFDISYWGTNEGMNSSNGSLRLEVYQGYNWITHYTFDLSELSKNRDSRNEYYFSFPKVTRFRLIVECSNPSGDSNKGRIVIGDMRIYY